MTEKQKEEFRNWLLRLVEAQNVISDNEYTKIDGLDELAGHCECIYRVQLDNKAFGYAIETFEPVIEEEEKVIYERQYIYRSFKLDGIKILSLFDKEVNANG